MTAVISSIIDTISSGLIRFFLVQTSPFHFTVICKSNVIRDVRDEITFTCLIYRR